MTKRLTKRQRIEQVRIELQSYRRKYRAIAARLKAGKYDSDEAKLEDVKECRYLALGVVPGLLRHLAKLEGRAIK